MQQIPTIDDFRRLETLVCELLSEVRAGKQPVQPEYVSADEAKEILGIKSNTTWIDVKKRHNLLTLKGPGARKYRRADVVKIREGRK